MILNENPIELFKNGRDLWKEIQEILKENEYLEFEIELKKFSGKTFLHFSVWNSLSKNWDVFNTSIDNLIKWIDLKKLLMQKITL
jgi:hypothetical protein